MDVLKTADHRLSWRVGSAQCMDVQEAIGAENIETSVFSSSRKGRDFVLLIQVDYLEW